MLFKMHAQKPNPFYFLSRIGVKICSLTLALADFFLYHYKESNYKRFVLDLWGGAVDDNMKMSINAIKGVMCDDDDCQKNRIKRLVPLLAKNVDDGAMLRGICRDDYGCVAATYDKNV